MKVPLWIKGRVPPNFWKNPDNRHQYMVWLGQQLAFEKPEDWYNITTEHFKKNRGHRFLAYYRDSLSAAVMDYLPEYEWRGWLFVRVPLNFWQKAENRHRYMTWLGENLGYKAPEDWYNITKKDFHRNSGYSLLAYYLKIAIVKIGHVSQNRLSYLTV